MTENELTEKEFREKVNERNPEEPEVAKERACDVYLERHETLKGKHISGAVELAMVISGYSFSYLYDEVKERYLWTTDTVSIAPDRLTDDTIIQSDRVLDQIEPETQKVRERMFGEQDPPFDKNTEAIGWIREVVEEAKEDSPNGEGLKEEIMNLVSKYRDRVGDVDIRFKDYSIRYFTLPDCKIFKIDGIPPGTRLDPLFRYQKKYSKVTGFTEPALLLYIMTGIRPLLPRWKVKKIDPDLDNLPSSFSIDVYADNVTEGDLNQVYRKVKEMKGISTTQPFKERDRILIAVVDSLGGVPEENVQRFWKEVLERCQEKGVEEWSTSNSAKMRWRRLQERLD